MPCAGYQVRSGTDGASWSAVRSFRSGYSSGVTKFAMFGDMGVFKWSKHTSPWKTLPISHCCCADNMANLLQDKKDETIDAVLMLGDHCYNLGMGNMKRGDGYMDAFEPVISELPWLPVIGK